MNKEERKARPVFTGVIKYFPKALMEIARVSLAGNKQHHPDKPLHWDREKSTDDFDALSRHLIDAGTIDDFNQTSIFVSSIEKRQGLKIACLEEIALLNKWIDKKKLIKAISFYGNCDYSKYLKTLI